MIRSMSIESREQLSFSLLTLARGSLLIALTVLYIIAETAGLISLKIWAGAIGAVYLLCVVSSVRWSRRAFVAIGLALSVYAVLGRDDGWALVAQALAGFTLNVYPLFIATGKFGTKVAARETFC